MENISIVTIELREAVPYFVEQADNLLLIHFAASSIPPRPFEEAKLPSWKQVIAQTIVEPEVTEVTEAEEVEVPKEISIPEVTYLKPTRKYTGEKITLDFFETDIKNVFRILREVSKRNFAIDKDVKGKVTLTFEKPVPWDQVLDLILKMNQLGRVFEGNIIRIATLKTLKKEDNDRRAKKAAQIEEEKKTRERKKILEPLVTEYIAINYSNAKSDILPHLSNLLTKDRGSLSVDERTNLIIITDTSDKIEQAKQIVQKLDVVTPQVIIQARIVEATTNFSREIGVQWGGGVGVQPTSLLPGDIGPNTSSIDNAVGVGPARGYSTLGGTYGYNSAMNFPIASTTAGSIGFNFVRIAGTPLVLNAKLSAMETEGEVKIISAPKIVTLDNKKATIRQGLSYPYLKLDASGNTTTEFKDIDLVLEVTPHVTPDNRISMKMNIKKNDLGDVILGQQSFTTREAQTELLVNDGDTIVIGGIITKTKRRSQSGLPGLSKIPIIGWLFKSKTKSDRKEELLIFITSRIVHLEQRAIAESY
jgi:type IV pilus assembly protein PilQ